MRQRRAFSLFIAGLGRLNFIHVYHLLQFKMLKKFTHCSTDVVRHVMDCYLLDSHLNELCHNYAVCLSMPVIAVNVQLMNIFGRPLVCLCA